MLIRINTNGFQPTEDISLNDVFTPNAEIAITSSHVERVDKSVFSSLGIMPKLPAKTKKIKPTKKYGNMLFGEKLPDVLFIMFLLRNTKVAKNNTTGINMATRNNLMKVDSSPTSPDTL